MHSRGRLIALVCTAATAWIGCNSLLGIETAVFAPDGGPTVGDLDGGEGGADDGSSGDGSDLPDATPCVDTQSNPKHCGACNHDCFGGACTGGVCGAVVLATDVGGPFSIATDASHVYWSNVNTNQISRVAKTGGAVEVLYAAADPLGFGIAVANGQVLFSVLSVTSAVYQCPVTGCAGAPPTVVVVGTASTFDLAAGGVLTFTDFGAKQVYRCVLPCGSAELIATEASFPSAVTGALGRVYWGTLASAVRLREDAKATVTVDNSAFVGQIVISGDSIVYAPLGSGPKISLLDGGARRTVYAPYLNNDHVAVRDGRVFFNDYGTGSTGRIFDCPLSGCGDGGAVATGQDRPEGVAVDESSIYWVNQGTSDAGAILRLAR